MKNLSPRAQGLIAINIAAVIFSSSALYGKLDVSPFWIVAMRTGFAALTLLVFSIWKKDIRILPRPLWRPAIVTGMCIGLHWLLFFSSVQLAGIAIATLTFATFPLFTVLFEAWHEKRKPHWIEIAAGVIIVIAVALLVRPRGAATHNLAGSAIGLASAVVCAMFYYFSKPLNAALPPRDTTFWQTAIACVAISPSLLFAAPAPHLASDWLLLFLLGSLNTALMLQLYLYSLKRLSAGTCSSFVALEPVYAILFAAVFFHEPVTLWVIVSGALIIGASFTLLKLESKP